MKSIAALLCLFVTTIALAAEHGTVEKKYPPYPDVWGRKLPVPEGEEDLPSVYQTPNGDLLIKFSWRTRGP